MRYETLYEVRFSTRYGRLMMFKLVYSVEGLEGRPGICRWLKVHQEEVAECSKAA